MKTQKTRLALSLIATAATRQRTLIPSARSAVWKLLAVALLSCASASSARAQQNIQFTQGKVGGGLDNTLQIPLRTYPGRGAASLPVTLYYSSKVWRIGHLSTHVNDQQAQLESVTEAVYAEHSTAGWTTSLDVPKLEWPKESDHYNYNGKEHCGACGTGGGWRIARIYVHMPDGSKHELRKSDSAYQGGVDYFGTFYAVDGSRLRYDSTGVATGTLFLPDGSRYVLGSGAAQFIDRNGNTLGYNAASRQWTDALGRVVGMPLPASPLAQDYTYSLPGAPGTYTFRFRQLSVALTPGSPAMRSIGDRYLPFPDQPPTPPSGNNYAQPTTTQSLFFSAPADDDAMFDTLVVGRNQAGSALFNPVVLTQIVLPDGTSYSFSYNIYGEIDKIVYPTGGYDSYQYASMPGLGRVTQPYVQGNRGVTQWRQSARGDGTDAVQWSYAVTSLPGTSLAVTTTAPDNTRTIAYKHNFLPEPFGANNSRYWPFGYEEPRNGVVYEERVHAPNADGSQGPMVRRKLVQWERSSQVIPQRLGVPGERVVTAYRNVRSNKDVSVVLDTGGNALTSTATYLYDTTHQFTTGVELTSSSQHHYASTDQTTAQTGAITGMPVGPLARTAETSYLTWNSAYRDRNLLGLPTLELIRDGGGNVVAKKETLYDEAAYPLFNDYPAVTGWTNPQTNVRGNATTVRRYADIGLGTYLETHARYDQCGSVRHSWDAHEPGAPNHGRTSQVAYTDSFSDGINRNTYAYPTRTTTPVPDPSGVYGTSVALETATVYEFQTGLVTSATDANNQTTLFSYADDLGTPDPLLRLRKVTRPAGGGWTKYNYGFGNNAGLTRFFVETITALDAARATSSYQFHDGLGRPDRAFLYVGPGAYDTTDRQYDNMGRAWRASQPYRTAAFSDPVLASAKWTTTAYDSLGRLRTMTTADGAVVDTSYSGSEVTVTDQTGKKRRSRADALGRLTQVVEDPAGLAYQTDYTYDALGNLRRVEQGSQQRFYMYDALSRLVRVKNPEQNVQPAITGTDSVTGNNVWTLQLSYDAYSNLQSRVDARGITTNYTYDNLNRTTTIRYVNDPAATHGVDLYYDNQPNAKGALWKVAKSYDYTETLDRDATGRPRRNRQWFYSGGLWRYYDTTCVYDLTGHVTEQVYPSGHTTSYQYDAAGRPADHNGQPAFKGTLGDGVMRTYATGVQYDEAGRVRQEQFGTQTPVYNKSFYNVRGQLSEIRVSTHSLNSGNPTNWNRGALINHYSHQSWAGSGTDNDGSLKKQDIYIPADDQISGYSLTTQFYYYDALNRLDQVREQGNGPERVQDYDYDRYGNQTVNVAGSSGFGLNNKTFTVDAASNRLGVPSGQAGTMAYDYAGNLTTDTYSANAGTRQYDAEGRMYRETAPNGSVTGVYTYDGAGRRVRRWSSSGECWYVYGLGGELVAEYGAGFTGASVQQEYGYRGGALLVVASGHAAEGLQGDYFNSLDFTGAALTRTDPTVDFEWHGASPGGGVNPDIFTARWTGFVTPLYTETYTFYTQSDDGVRLWVNGQLVIDKWIDQGWTEWSGQITLEANRRYEIRMEFYERYGGAIAKLLWASASQAKQVIPSGRLTPPQGSSVKWLVADQLGTPRMTIDQTGALSKMTRHDYLPYGEEIGAGVGGRTYLQGYVADGTRQQFTGHERDKETGLDFMQARFYSGSQGRFVSVDTMAGAAVNPQSLNLYAYVLGNPLRYTDPTGHAPASYGWNTVAGGFWGGYADEHFGGIGIINDRMAEQEDLINTRMAGILANHYLNKGNWAAAMQIMRANPGVGLVDAFGQTYWGSDAANMVGRTNSSAASISLTSIELLDGHTEGSSVIRRADVDQYNPNLHVLDVNAPVGPAVMQGEAFTVRINFAAQGDVQWAEEVKVDVPKTGRWRLSPASASTDTVMSKVFGDTTASIYLTFRIRDDEAQNRPIKVTVSGHSRSLYRRDGRMGTDSIPVSATVQFRMVTRNVKVTPID